MGKSKKKNPFPLAYPKNYPQLCTAKTYDGLTISQSHGYRLENIRAFFYALT